MKSRSLLLSTTALLAVLSTPAFAQSIDQNTFTLVAPPTLPGTGSGVSNGSQSSSNTANISAPGTIVTSVTGQISNNQLNAIGGSAPLSLNDTFAVNQAAGGGFNYTTLNQPYAITGTVTQSATNSTSATATGPAISAAYAGGNQSAMNAINSANLAPTIGSGSISQVVGGATLTTTNAMAATVQNGNAMIQGSNGGSAGFQSAVSALNTANVQMGAGLTGAPSTTPSLDLSLNQKLAPAVIVNSSNSAVANTFSSSPVLDPSVKDIGQTSTIGLNQLSLAAASYTTGSGSSATTTVVPSIANLDGSQKQSAAPYSPALTIGNAAVAYTGASAPNYNLFGTALGNGTSVVSGVTQMASLGMNNVTGGAGVSMNFSNAATPADGFKQSFDGVGTSLVGPSGTSEPGIINLAAARTNTGSATVLGSSGSLTQGFNNQINSVSTGGSTTGIATQAASNVDQTQAGGTLAPATIGLSNVAAASTVAGAAKLTNVSQSMNQAFNSFGAAGGATNLQLNQTSDTMNIGSNNVQVAGGSTKTEITGAVQIGSTTLNTATLGTLGNAGLGTTQVVQKATSVTIGNSNALTASSPGFNASVNGVQQSTSAVNVIK